MLIDSLTFLEQGDLAGPKPCWSLIAHRDIKLDNIFLGDSPTESDGQHFAMYPRVKLGDFGLAVRIAANDTDNPLEYVFPGTQGFRAPEQIDTHFNFDGTAYLENVPAFSTKVNIWALGVVMMALMTLNEDIGILDFHPQGRRVPTLPDDEWTEVYSDELKATARACVAYMPAQRQSLAWLKNRVQIRLA